MRDLNVNYFDLYKQLDNAIKQSFQTKDGVTEYINRMVENSLKGAAYIKNWDAQLKALKRLRWIRSQLAHEVSFDSDICNQQDYNNLSAFYRNFQTFKDPLRMLDAVEAAIKRRQETLRQQQIQAHRQPPMPQPRRPVPPRPPLPPGPYPRPMPQQYQTQTKKSFWQKLFG
ncbi:MAG: hypothetical protein J6Z00_03405 [Clostridia bacterium]|nr:hypothetical protein [Clostridia bacterium]